MSQAAAATNAPPRSKHDGTVNALRVGTTRAPEDFPHAHPLAPSHFELREDGSIGTPASGPACSKPTPNAVLEAGAPATPRLVFHDASHRLWLYHGNCLELLDAIYARHGNAGRFDAIFADPPYFLSNGGITCHAGKMVKVHKDDWDNSISKTFGAARSTDRKTQLRLLHRAGRTLQPIQPSQ